jgi:hypothetical protein
LAYSGVVGEEHKEVKKVNECRINQLLYQRGKGKVLRAIAAVRYVKVDF